MTKQQAQDAINNNLPDNTTNFITPLKQRTAMGAVLEFADGSSGSPDWSDIQNKPATFAPAAHTHDTAAITSGLLPIARGGTGTSAPGLVAGANISLTGSWPNQTITASGTLDNSTIAAERNARYYTDNIMWLGGPISALPNGSGGFTVSVPDAYIVFGGFTNWFGQNIFAGFSGTVPNGNVLILDTSVNGGAWTVAEGTFDNVKSTPGKIMFLAVLSNEIYSPLPEVQERVLQKPYGLLKDLLYLHTEWVYTTIQGRNPITSISQGAASAWSISITDAYFLTGNLNESEYYSVGSYSGSLPNGNCLCFEFAPNNNVTIVNVPSILANVRSNIKRVPFLINSFGTLLSPSPVVTEYVKQAQAFPIVIHKKVDINGTVGVNCDYNTIVAAINDITDATTYKRYVLNVANGLYSTNQDIIPKDWIDVRGQSKEGVILVGARVPASPGGVSTIYIVDRSANATFSNLTILGVEDQYAVHFDCPTGGSFQNPMITVFHNCIIRQFENLHAIGIGIYNNQTLRLIDCEIMGRGIYAHNGGGNAYGNKPLSLEIIGTRINGTFTWANFGTNQAGETVTFDGCKIGVLDLSAGSTTIPYTNFVFKNTEVGSTSYDGNLLSLLGGKHLYIPGHNRTVYNTSASAISAGYAVIEQPSTGGTVTYPSDETQSDRIAPYTGSGIFAGFAELAIAANSLGTIQISGNPKAYFNTSGGNVVYGDQLELNSSGQVVKRSTGTLIAYALASASANGLLSVKLAK